MKRHSLLILLIILGIGLFLPGTAFSASANVLLIVSDDADPDPTDLQLAAYLTTNGLTVFYANDNDTDYTDDIAANSIDVVYVSATSSSSATGNEITNLSVGVVEANVGDWDEVLLSSNDDEHPGTDIEIFNNTHYITSGLTLGNLPVYSPSAQIGYGETPGSGAQILARNPSDSSESAILAYETGAQLDGGTPAPARRVGIFTEDLFANWTVAGQTLVLRAILWAAGSGASVPAATSAVAEISPNNVVTSATANAFTYDILVTMGIADSGVNRVDISVPGTYGAPTVTNVLVGGTPVAYTNNTAGNLIRVDLTAKVISSNTITVLFSSDSPGAPDAGTNFTSTVDDTDTADAAQATTEGNADGDAPDNNSWTVTTANPAYTVNYRSIGTNAAVLYSSGNASITANTSTVTFSGATLPTNIGVGDELVIGTTTFYILSRDSSSQVTVQETAVSSLTNQSYTIQRAYNALGTWEGDRDGDLVAENRREVGVAYADGAFSSFVLVDDSTTDATHYMTLTVAEGQRHDGTSGTGVIFNGGGATSCFRTNDDYTRFEWFEITGTCNQNGSPGANVMNATNVVFENLLIHDYYGFSCMGVKGDDNSSFTLRNSIIYDGNGAGIRLTETTSTALVENVTVYGITGRGIYEDSGTLTVRNSISMGNSSPDFDGGTQSYNLSDDSSAAGTGSIPDKDPALQFVNITPGDEANWDFHLIAGSDAINVGTDLSGSFTNDIDGDTRPISTQWEMGADETNAAASLNITGTVYEDVNGDADMADQAARNNVTVAYYKDGGDGQPDGVDDGTATTTASDGSGNYTFSGLSDGIYWVIVDSKTVSPNAGIKGGFAQGDVWPEQTYGTAGARCEDGAGGINVLGAAGPCYGGQSGIASDTASALATAEHVTRVVVSGGSVSGVNFGFSFNTVINTLAGDGQDDDGSNNRTVQGSLRQFIQNANAVTGANTMRFVPVRDPDASGSGQTWWQVTVTSILNAIDDADTTIDGTAYDYTDGTTIRNTNAATLGYVGAVGLGADALVSTGDEPTLAGVAGPELEIVNDRATNVVVIGLDLQADDITVDNIAIYGFGNGNLSQDADIRAGVSGGGTNFTGIVIEDSVIGTDAADFSDPGVGVRSLVNGVAVFGADGGIIRRNLIGYNGRFGIFLSDTAQTWTVQANEIRGNAIENFAQDGMDIGNGSSGATVSGNLFAMNQGSGVDSWNGLGNNLIENNTFLQNGLGATEPAGARIFGNSSIIRLNIFDNNIGAGIMLVDGDDPWADPTSIPAIQNRISRNRFTGNGENAIDLLANGADANVGDGITINDGGTDANAGNIGRDYPVITSALFNAGTTTVSGTTCANCEVEVYLAVAGSGDTDTGTDYGEGITYIDTDTADGGGNWSLATAALAIGNNVSAITIDGSGNTSEFGANVTVTADYNISGTIYDDVDGDADIVEGGTLTFANATVKLYLDDGDGLINAGDGLVTTTTTDGSGDYNFGGLADGTYYVVVDSMTLAATGYNGSFDINDVWAEQTYAVTGAASGAGFSGANGALYGGRNAGTSDDAAVLTTAEHVIQTTLSGADATGVNFGFSFNGVVNTLAGDAQDDDGGNNRTVQGSLRQFIQNANAIAGANAMRFVPAVPTNATGGGNNWWRVTVTSALPIITGDNTTLDGTAYSSVDGVTVRNDNPTVLGTGGNVGVNPLALSQVPGPELEIVGNNTLLIGLEIQGNDVTIRRFAIYGFGDGITLLTRQGNILLQQSGVLNTLIEANVLGSSAASFTDPGAGVRTGGANIWVEKPDGGTIRNNLIGFGGFLGIFLFDSAHNWTVENNEVRANGLIDLGTDGIDINADSNNAIVRGNLFEANNGSGVDMFNGGTTNLIENNTISNNGIGGQEDAGIRVYGDDHTIRRNIITTNAGSGIMITNDPGGSPPHDGNRISENAIYNNGNIGIDLHTGAENTALGTAPFITANDALDPDGGANLGQNFPIITSAIWNGANTIVQGTLNSTPGANFDIEVFSNTVCNGDTLGVAQADPYGEGETYRDTANDTTDGVTGDMTFSVSIPVNLTGQSMTATAINTVTDDTSEFSQCETVVVLGSAAGRWTFDEGSGQTAGDASGNGHDGTLGSTAGADTNDPSWICVLGGYALDFDGIDDFVLITDPGGAWDFADGGLDAGTSDFSIAAWVRYDTSAPDGFPTIIRKGGGSDTNAGYWFAYEKSVDGFRLNVSDGTNRFIANSNIGIGLADGQWHYVTAVFDREAGTDTAYFYLDANPIGSESSALIADNSVSGTDDLGIGGNPNGTLRPWKGAIDDTRIYDRVLSQAEITALAASPPTACPASASGTVFEDINYGGGDGRTFAAADASAQASGWGAGAVGAGTGVVVELYQDQSGNFIKIDDTTTDAAGDYSFTSLPDGTYRVRVVNGTVVSNRGSNATGNTPLAVQTFRNDPDSGGGVVNEVGGADPADQDDGVQANGVNIATITAQSVTEIVLAGAGVGNVDFGFNFDTIVNTNNAGQGSLRQFLLNSNELDNVNLDQQDNPSGVTAVNKIAGDEHSIFMIPAAELAATIDGGGGTVMLIQPSSALPVITDGDTAVDGSTQTAYTGDTNSAVAETTTGPEVIVDLQGIVAADVLQVNAANTIIDSMGITGADGGLADGIRNESVDGMISRNNTVFNNDKTGVRLFRVSNAQILNSVIRNNGTTDSDGITLSSDNSNSNNTISGNEIINNAGYGIDIDGATDTNNTITNNLIKGNGTGGAGQEAGIGLRDGDGNTISLNTITANTAEGIFISTGNTGNRISQNSIFNNGTLGTDMSGGSGTAGDGVSANDNLDPDGGGNNRQNFPVITSAIWNGANTVVQGTLNSLVGSTFDIEVFSSAVCNGDTGGTPTGAPNDYGEGQTYRITAGGVGTDGSGNASFNVNIPVNLTGQYITATAINTATNDTSEFSQCEAAVALVAISGTVYEDPNGDADMADQVARDTVTVALFRDGGDNQPDGVDDTFINTTTTAGGGAYSFSGLAPATYWVAVDSKTVTPSAGYNGGFGLGDVWAEQTYGIAGSWCANGSGGTAQIGAAGACFGGQDAATSDNVSAPITVADLPTAEHVTRVVVAAAVNEVNFGFSFNAVVATRDGDDDGANNRTIQGSLRQFIQHANALSGANTMRFTPAGPTNAAGGGGNWWQINPASTLDSITDADTIIDGRAYARADGVTVIDPNAGSLGTGGTVGVDPLALSQVARPELELFDTSGINMGLNINAADVTVRRLSIWAFGNSFNPASNNNANIQIGNVTGAIIEENVIGTPPNSFADPVANRTLGPNIRSINGDNGTISNNLIGFSESVGIYLSTSADNWLVENSEIRGNAIGHGSLDGIDLSVGSINATIRGNLITANSGAGVDMYQGGGQHTIENNTVTNHGSGGLEDSAIRLYGVDSTVQKNIVTANAGNGIMIVNNTGGGPVPLPYDGNLISQNRIYNNGKLGIDLHTAAENNDLGTAPYVTGNDGLDVDSGANLGQNFPVITSAVWNGANTVIEGSLNSTAGTTFNIEVFSNTVCNGDTTGTAQAQTNGEGETYRLTVNNVSTDGSGNASFSTNIPVDLTGLYMTATTINPATDDTSEFSACVQVAVPATIEFELAAASDQEANGGNLPRLIVTGTLTTDQTIEVNVTGGSAVTPGDFTNTAVVTIPAGTYSDAVAATINLSIVDDGFIEPDETINLQLANPATGLAIGDANSDSTTQNTHTYTILNDDGSATVQMASVSQSVGEGAGTATVTVQLNTAAALGTAVTVDVVDLLNGTAVVGAGNDYTYTTPTTVTFAIGATNGDTDTVTVTILDDADVEAGETINLQLQNVTGPATIPGATDDHTVTITDNEAGATVQMASVSQSVGEGAGTATVTVQLNTAAALGTAVTVDVVDLLNGTATVGAGNDYTYTTPTTVTFAIGATNGDTDTVTVTILDDADVEAGETINLQLQNVTGPATIPGATDDHTVTITDNEAGATVQMASVSQNVGEGAGTATVTVQLNTAAALGTAVTVDVVDLLNGTAVVGAGNDYTYTTPTTVTFAIGATNGDTDTVTVTILDDADVEAGETINLQLQNVTGPATIPGATDDHTVTITDNEAGATVQMASVSQNVGEGAGTATVTVQLNTAAALGTAVTVDVVDLLNGTAVVGAGNDYTYTTPTTVTFAIGATNGDTDTVTVTILDDAAVEAGETINLQLQNVTGPATIPGATDDHTVTITDNEAGATVQMASVSQNVGEGAGTATVTVQLNTAAALGTAVTVDVVDLLNGTAVVGAGNDYTYTTPTTVTFAIGATNGDTDTVTVTILDDADVEAGETINLQLQNVTGPATIPGATDDHTVTITDNEAGATVQMASVSQNVGEGAGTATVTVQLNTAAALGTAVTVDVVDLLNGTAVVGAGNDYTYTTPTTVTFAIGATNGDTDTVTVTILDDAAVEAGETINLQLQNVTGPATIPGATDDHTVTITDNEAGATVQMASVSQNVGEGAGTATVTVQLNTAAALGTAVTVDVVDLLNGTAVVGAGNDYTYTTPTTVTFAIGATNGDTDTVTVTILDDAAVEAGETINLQLQNVTGPATIPGATDDHTVTITDNEAGATVQMASVSQNVGEGAGTATVTVQLNTAAALGTAVTVDVVDLLNGTAVVGAGNDYTYTTPTTVTFAIGATNGDTDTVTVTILDDADVEAGETINLQLQNVTGPATIPGATDDHTVTITDNEAGATVQMASVSQNVGEGAGTATVTVQLNTAAALGTAVTVDVVDLLNGTAVVGAGNDYTYTTPTTVTFAIGATNGDTDTVTVTILDDAAVEAGETINLQLQNVTGPATIPGATDDHTVTITDNEAGATVQMAAASSAVAEDVAGGTLNVTVQLNVPGAGTLGSDVTLDVVDLLTGSATAAGTDYTFVTPTQVTFASGTADGATRTVTITIINDALTEVAEDLDLQLQNISGPATILGTNQDHTVTINDDEAGATVQMAAASSAVAEDVAGGTLDVTVQLNVPGAGTLGSDVTVDVVDLLTGSATAAGTDYTFVTPTQVTFAAGTPDGATDTVTITIINDALAEAAEDIDLQLQNISGPATIPGATDDHTVTINDDDSGATVEFELASAGDVESNGGNIPRLIANGTLVAPQTIDVTVTGGSATGGGTDYSNVVSVTIPAGNYSGTPAATINLTIIDDTSIEPNETIDFALANPSAGLGVGDANGDSTTQNTHTYTITDDDSPIVEFISASASDAESSGGNIPLLIVRGTLAAPATIDVNTTGGSATGGGVDYSSTALVTIPAGIYDGSLAMAIPINLTVVNDSLFENSETILLALANPSAGLTIADVNGDAGTQSANTYTILDDENSIVLRLTKSANKTEAAIGDIVTYKVQISNTIASDVPDARIVDYLPPNFKYVGDSARLNGAPLANPIGNRPLIFNIGTVPGLVDGNGNGFADPGEPGYLVVKYQLVVGSGAQPGDYENTAIAASGCNTCQISNSGSAEVSVTLSPLEGLTTIIGKVFLDKNRDGRQDPGETGVAGAMVALDNGTYALTDEHGRYHFPSVKAGQRLVKVNLQTLGAGAVATTKEAVVLWITPGLLAKANFGVFYETETVRIGRPGQSGIFLESQVLHKPLEVVGGAENLALLINGETASIPTDNVQLLVENLNEVVELKGNTPGSQILFKTEPGLRKDETSWRLKIMDAGGKVVRVLGGKGSLPGIVRWDGRYKKGQTVEGGEIYQYQMEVGYADGTRATSARKLFGINQNTAIFLNLTGEAFIFGSDRLSPKAKQVLKETAGVLRKYPEEKVIIEGHTDSVGTDEYNVDLSRRRAESALTYLINEEGLPPNRFVVRWYGESRPMASNEYDETRALNRRIEIKGQVDDVKRSKLYDQYRTKASVKINGKPVKVDTNGRFALEVADKSIKKLNVEVTSGRGQSYKTTIEVPSIEILNREEKVLLRYGNKSQEYQVGRPPETQGSDDKTPLVKYELRGKTEPGNTVEIDGASLPVNPDGTFAISLDLRRGNNPYGLMVRNPAGISRIVNLMATVNDRDKDGKLIVATGPAPNMHVNLPLKGVPLTSHHLTVTGATDVDNRIFINDEPVKVEINGYFSSIVNLPKGRSLLTIKAVNPEGHSSMIAREVEVTDTRLFFLALADGKVEGLMGSGFVQGAGMDDDTEYKTEGRMAFYLKGVIKGKYLITAALDTGTHEFDQLFDDLDDRENDRLLTNLDPDRIYPVYGDSSTVVYDTDSQGKLYLALDSDELHLLLGNFALNLNDTELAAYQRTLFGARIGYRSASKTQYGDSNTQVALFGAQVDQIPVTDELLATGGSLYYLSRRDIIEGSEQVTLVIRDQNTGLVLAEFLQQQNVDYNIIYSAGRILFKRPIATYSEGEEIIDQGLLPGNRVFIRVHYEAKEDMFENTAGGGRVRQQIGDHVAVGGTYIKDELDAGDYDLKSVDTEIRLGKNTRLVAEYAQSSGTGTLTFVSLDGGLTFADTAPDADREGNAWKVAAEIDIGEWFDSPGRYQIGGYYKRLDQGFFTSNTFLEEGTDKSGINLSLAIAGRDKVRARFDRVETDGTSLKSATRNDIGTFQWVHDHGWWSLTGEYQYRDAEDSTAGGTDTTHNAATRLTVKPIDPLTVEAEHQQTITGNTNNQTTVGVKYQVHPSLALEASGKSGTDGQAAWGGAVLTVGDHRLYLTERLVKDRAGQTKATVLGSESALGKSGKVYSEYQWEHTENGSLNKSVLGAQRQWDVAEGLKMNLSGQYLTTDANSDDGSQLAIAGGFSYAHPSGFRFSTREEIRRDTGDREFTQLVTSNDLEYKINSDFTSLGWFRWSKSYDDNLDETEASFTELSLGLAYRPVASDRFNALAKYTWLKQNGPQGPGEDEVLKPMTQVAAIDWSLDVTPWMEWEQKGAFRIFSEDVADMPTETTHSFLSVSRLNFNVWSDWYLGAEYRMLLQNEADDSRQGWATELMWEPLDHLRIGVGYNFTDFSDNEYSDNDYSTHGLYFRFQGNY